jgi:hypothetical protein
MTGFREFVRIGCFALEEELNDLLGLGTDDAVAGGLVFGDAPLLAT